MSKPAETSAASAPARQKDCARTRQKPSAPARPRHLTNRLYRGDCLALLRAHIPPGAIDLVYCDPPFGSGANYPRTHKRAPPVFCDRWQWDAAAARNHAVWRREADALDKSDLTRLVDAWFGRGARAGLLARDGRAAWLAMLGPRALALWRALKPGGSLFWHGEPKSSHYVRWLLDATFGAQNFRNEIVWHYTGGGRSKTRFSQKHDVILWYSKGAGWHFDIDAMRVPYKPGSGYARAGITARSGKTYRPHARGTPLDDVWDIPMLNPLAAERLGYPTQKPLALLRRLIAAASQKGDMVLDPFCGSGTSLAAAQELGRRWIGMDAAGAAIACARARLSRCKETPARVEGPVGLEPTTR